MIAAAGAGLAYYLSVPRDSGIAACQRVEELGEDLAAGGRPILTRDEFQEIADDLTGSENEVLSHFGREFLRWHLVGEPDRFKGAQGTAYLHSQVGTACVVAGLDMKTVS